MTILVSDADVVAPGNGAATTFSFSPLVIAASNELVVTHVVTATGVETLLVEGTGATKYAVVVSAYPGTGSIRYPEAGGTPLPSTEKLVIKRVVPLTQLRHLSTQAPYSPSVQEAALDQLTKAVIQQQETIDRSYKVPAGDASPVVTLPAAASRANKYFSFDIDGNPVIAAGTTDATPHSAFITTLHDDASAAAVRATLGSTSVGDALFIAASAAAARTTLGLTIGIDVLAYSAQVAYLNVAQSFTKTQSVAIVSLTSTAASIAVDASASNEFSHTFTENTTLANPTNLVAGTKLTFYFTQHASSPKTLAFGSSFDFQGGAAPSVTATNSARDTLVCTVRSTTQIECVLLKGWS